MGDALRQLLSARERPAGYMTFVLVSGRGSDNSIVEQESKVRKTESWRRIRRIPTVTGIPASLRMSSVGLVTKPAPSMSTLLHT